MKVLTVYTDGAISKTVGGWACVIIEDNKVIRTFAGRELDATNNKMELQGVIEAMNEVDDEWGLANVELTIYSDSEYVVKGASEWLNKWKNNNWKGSNGKVKNREYWEKLDALKQKCSKVQFLWVRGHNGNVYNEMVDKLAVAQYKEDSTYDYDVDSLDKKKK